jgi:hypothetical protein
MRRISVIGAALAVALLGGLFALQASGAGAQGPTHEVFVFSDIPLAPNSLGQGSVPVGTDDGVLGADCQGNSPLGGTPNSPLRSSPSWARHRSPCGSSTTSAGGCRVPWS